jgi:hypothetical protein
MGWGRPFEANVRRQWTGGNVDERWKLARFGCGDWSRITSLTRHVRLVEWSADDEFGRQNRSLRSFSVTRLVIRGTSTTKMCRESLNGLARLSVIILFTTLFKVMPKDCGQVDVAVRSIETTI